ncbi:MAG: hypothetical protein VB108_11310, partial [Anaerolineaceae bacterium]|nr:hypothetical protein [Anaerolineaceae bacterium]
MTKCHNYYRLLLAFILMLSSVFAIVPVSAQSVTPTEEVAGEYTQLPSVITVTLPEGIITAEPTPSPELAVLPVFVEKAEGLSAPLATPTAEDTINETAVPTETLTPGSINAVTSEATFTVTSTSVLQGLQEFVLPDPDKPSVNSEGCTLNLAGRANFGMDFQNYLATSSLSDNTDVVNARINSDGKVELFAKVISGSALNVSMTFKLSNGTFELGSSMSGVTLNEAKDTVTVSLERMDKDSSFLLPITVNPVDGVDYFSIESTLTGTYIQSEANAACQITVPEAPSVVVEPCKLNLAGQTVFPIEAGDISARDKFGVGGEINADGWGAYPNRFFRLYAAVDKDVKNVTVSYKAAQGFKFVQPSAAIVVITGSASGMGMLYGNGYTAAATGIGTVSVSADGSEV